jgi:hypothetical protein
VEKEMERRLRKVTGTTDIQRMKGMKAKMQDA